MKRGSTSISVDVDVDLDDFDLDNIVDYVIANIDLIGDTERDSLIEALGVDDDFPIELTTVRDERKMDIIKEYWDMYTPDQLEERLKP